MATSTSSTASNSSSGRLGSASPAASVICQEVFDDTCQPSAEEIADYAQILGIDPVKEAHLMHLAKEGLMQALPAEWKICYSEEKCGHYYYNTRTKHSQWDHPLDAVYRELVEQARQRPSNGATAATPIVDNSDDASQMDSGIRSLQGNDDCDTANTATNNTCDTSSPVSNVVQQLAGGSGLSAAAATGVRCNGGGVVAATAFPLNGGGGASHPGSNTNSTSTSGFSGGVSRFLESRTKNFVGLNFQPVKNTRFEVAKTSLQIGLNMKFPAAGATAMTAAAASTSSAAIGGRSEVDGGGKGFTLSGTGAMFLKSRRQLDNGLNQASAMMVSGGGGGGGPSSIGHIIVEGMAGTPPGVKGILRDSSLTDMRRRADRADELEEDRKIVRFNLDDTKMRGSPEDDGSSSRRLTQSPELSINSDDDAVNDDDDPWDDDDDEEEDGDEDVGILGMGSLTSSTTAAEGGCGYQRSLNPFLVNDEKHVRDIKVIAVPKAQTIQMLKAQSFSMDMPERDRCKLAEFARSHSVDVNTAAAAATATTPVSYLDKLKESASAVVKPLYEDTDSESKGSSVRSFIVNRSVEESVHTHPSIGTNPFDLDELGRKHSRDVEQLELKLQSASGGGGSGGGGGNASISTSASEKAGLRTLKVASKLVGFLKKDFESKAADALKLERDSDRDCEALRMRLERERQTLLKDERERLEEQLQDDIDAIKREHEQKLKSIRHEYELRLTSHQHQLDESYDVQLEECRQQLADELAVKRQAVVDEHKTQMATLQQNHAEILQDLERDLKSEAEIVRKEHTLQLAELRDKMAHELEVERQRMRDTGDDRLYEKVRCEKRLLEDKYRCLKEKYVRLKTDVKLSLERRNRRREAQAMHQQQQSLHTATTTNTTTGSETERSISNKPSLGGNSENRSLSLSTSCQDHYATNGTTTASRNLKPPVPPKTPHLSTSHTASREQQRRADRSADRSGTSAGGRKPGIASKYIKHLQVQDDNTTSISQSDTTISNNYTKGRYLPATAAAAAAASVTTVVVSDNGNSDSEAALHYNNNNQENNNNSARMNATAQRKKAAFSRLKSASTSRLNSDNNYKTTTTDRPCTPVENLRHQLQKLEDLEDQFPDNTLDATYHLRYPFSDISNEHAGASSELEFFKHRIHLERDSVRRAKESLRTQRTNFRARQREIKQRHKATVTRHTLDQLIQEEKELTEMEVNLHRTRALLGEKVIRLRHLEQSLLRVYEKEKPPLDLLGVEPKDEATLSDLSSHSSSGFSSTDFASGAGDMQNVHKRKELYHQESSECIQNLEILNAEIREILDILGKNQQQQQQQLQQQQQQQHHTVSGMAVPMISPSELNWSHMLGSGGGVGVGVTASTGLTAMSHGGLHGGGSGVGTSMLQQHHTPQSIPTLADRLETYRQLATGRMQSSMGGAVLAANTIVSQSPRALNYTTSLVERTRDLRNWLRQAKTEHEMLTGMAAAAAANAPPLGMSSMNATGLGGGGGSSATGIGGGGGGSGIGGGSGMHTNL